MKIKNVSEQLLLVILKYLIKESSVWLSEVDADKVKHLLGFVDLSDVPEIDDIHEAVDSITKPKSKQVNWLANVCSYEDNNK